MHWFDVGVVFTVLLLVGVELSVSAFVNPGAWRLDAASQAKMLSHFGSLAGRVMPVWYSAGLVLLAVETWLHRQTPGLAALFAASAIWLLALLASVLFLVPLNKRVVEGAAGWQQLHRMWDRRHRVRIVALSVAGVLLTYAVVC